MVEEKEYKKLKKQADDAKTEHDRAAGQLEAAMSRLEEEFDCEDLVAAEKLLKKLDSEATKAEGKYEKAKTKFEEEWAERVDDE